jgi:hypothetical protein
VLFVNFPDFVANTEAVVREVLQFVGADTSRYSFKPLPPGMKVGPLGALLQPPARLQLLCGCNSCTGR